jgi:hypothetical protein
MTNEARNRIWNDDAVMTTVSLPDHEVRTSDEAMDVLRNEGAEAYEKYVAEHSGKKT